MRYSSSATSIFLFLSLALPSAHPGSYSQCVQEFPIHEVELNLCPPIWITASQAKCLGNGYEVLTTLLTVRLEDVIH